MISLLDRAVMRFPDKDGFRVTASLLEDIKSMLRGVKPNPVRIATQFGVPVSLVRFVMNELPATNTKFTVLSEDGWGREELRPYIVARKPAMGVWAESDADALQEARNDYDEGAVEMAQGRDGDFIIQYALPRRKRAKRTYAYFQLETDHEG